MIYVYEEFAEPSRRQILAELSTGSKNVRELVCATKLKQPNLSTHLARLKGKGIVRATKTGREVYYSLANPEIESFVVNALSKTLTRPAPITLDAAAESYTTYALSGDEQACSEILDALFADQIGIIDLYLGLIVPVMRQVGLKFANQEISTAQEHMASAITERMMMRIVQHYSTGRKVERTAILGCGPNSWHTIGLRMASDYLRTCGWRTMFLGANVPHECFISTVESSKPDIVLLSCKTDEGVQSGLTLVKELNSMRSKQFAFCIGVGGCCAADHQNEFMAEGADFITNNLQVFAEEVVPCIEKHGKLKKGRCCE